MGLVNIYIVPEWQRLVQNDKYQIAVNLPSAVQGDAWSIKFVALDVNPDVQLTLSRKSVGSYTPKVALRTSAGVTLALQDSWTADAFDNSYSGVLALNTAEITAAVVGLTAGQWVTVYAEIKIVDGAGNILTAYPATAIKLYSNQIPPGTTVTLPSEVTATQAWVNNLFVPKQMVPGDVIIMSSPNGTQFIFGVDDNGQPTFTQIT